MLVRSCGDNWWLLGVSLHQRALLGTACSVSFFSTFFPYVHARFVTIMALFQVFTFNGSSHGKERRNIALSSGPGHDAEIEQMMCPPGQGINKIAVINAPQHQIADQVARKVSAVPCRQSGLAREPVHRR